MDIFVLDKNVLSSLRENFNQTESVVGHIAKGHKRYECLINLYNFFMYKAFSLLYAITIWSQGLISNFILY